MNGSEYLFALYIFVLIVVLFFLYRQFILLPKGKRKAGEEAEDGKEKEQRLFRLYQNIEEMMDNFEAYIEDTRDQMENIKGQMKQQADYINGLLQRVEAAEAGARSAMASLKNPEKAEPEREPQKGEEPAKTNGESGKRGARAEVVRDLLGRGMTVEQIAQKLELSINEVRLIVYGMMTKTAEGK